MLGFKALFVSSSLLQLPLFRCFGMSNSLLFQIYIRRSEVVGHSHLGLHSPHPGTNAWSW